MKIIILIYLTGFYNFLVQWWPRRESSRARPHSYQAFEQKPMILLMNGGPDENRVVRDPGRIKRLSKRL
jgi:hypothetical protein